MYNFENIYKYLKNILELNKKYVQSNNIMNILECQNNLGYILRY
jgi:hypothetical protein